MTETKNPQRRPQGAELAQESAEELWKNKRFVVITADGRAGDVHFRVITDQLKEWILVCETCWPNFRNETGYRYGGIRKANRRNRK